VGREVQAFKPTSMLAKRKMLDGDEHDGGDEGDDGDDDDDDDDDSNDHDDRDKS
jgi:hypothetical protein